MGSVYQIQALKQVRDNHHIHTNMKHTVEAFDFKSREFQRATSPCRQELQTPNFDLNRFRSTESNKTTSKDNDNVVIARSRDFGKILQFLSRKDYVDKIWATESAADTIQVLN